MMQQLKLPFRRPVLAAAYKNKRYKSYHGFTHYGWDMGCDEAGYRVLASGDGIVIAAGMDGTCLYGPGDNLGNCIVIVYRDVLCPDGKVQDVACRMFHFDSGIAVSVGQQVHAGTVLGDYGDTYAQPCGKHLHIEFDSDTRIVDGRNYAQYAVGIAQSGKIIKRGSVDSTIDPRGLFYRGLGQTVRGCPGDDGRDWYSDADINLPMLGKAMCPTCGREM